MPYGSVDFSTVYADTGSTDYATIAVDAAPQEGVAYYTMDMYGTIRINDEKEEIPLDQLLEDADWIL